MKILKTIAPVNYLSIVRSEEIADFDGIPVRQLQMVRDRISLYRKLLAVTAIANTVLATLGFIYL